MNRTTPVSDTPLLRRPNVQHLITILGGISAGVMLPAYFPAIVKDPTILGGATNAVGGLAGNLLATFLQKCFDRRENDPTLPDVNGDFLRLVGNAIAGDISRFANDPQAGVTQTARAAVLTLARKASAGFVELVQSEKTAPIQPHDVLASVATNTPSDALGEINNWRRLVSQLANHCQVTLDLNTMIALARWLRDHLRHSLETELKRDFAGEGKAYAVLHLSFMGAVLSQLQTLITQPKEQERLARDLSDKVERLVSNTNAPAFQEVYRTYFDDQFAQLKDLLGDHFARVEEAAKGRHAETQQNLQGLDTKLEEITKLLMARAPGNDLELGQLRDENDQLKAQLQAALQRLAEAEAKGDVTASETLVKLRENGDPKPLGAFLDQRLLEKDTERIELLRERAAVAYISGEIARSEQCTQQLLALLPDDLDATCRLGHIYLLRGDLAIAEEHYRRLLELAPDEERVKAVAMGNLGVIYQTRGQLDEAEHYHREALQIENRLGQLVGQAKELGNLGLICRTRGQLDEAEHYFRDALRLNQQLGRLEGQANELNNLGVICHTRGQLDEAEHYFRDALRLNQQLGRLEGQAIQLDNLGLIHHARGQLEEAEWYHCESLRIEEHLGNLKGQASSMCNLGVICKKRGQLEKAEQYYRQALSIEQHLGRLEGQAAILSNLGVIFDMRGKLEEAARLQLEALAINKKLESLEGQAQGLTNLGVIYQQRRKHLVKAERYHREALAINGKLGSLGGRANTLSNLGIIYRKRGLLTVAERYHREALAINEKLRSLEGQAHELSNLGVIAQRRGQLDEAEKCHREALSINQQLGLSEDQAIQLGNLGGIAEYQGNIQEARRLWNEAYNLFTQVGATSQQKLVESWLAGLPKE